MMVLQSTLVIITASTATLNAVSRLVLNSWQTKGWYNSITGLFDINVFTLVAFAASTYFLTSRTFNHTQKCSLHDYLAAGVCLLLCCLPSAMLSWISLGGYTGYMLIFGRIKSVYARTGCIIMLGIALREPAAFLLLKTFAAPVLSIDAAFAKVIAGLNGAQITRETNMLVTQTGRQILILSGCSSVHNLSYITLAWLTVSRSLSHHQWRRIDALSLAMLVGFTLILNWIRLSALTLSPYWYDLAHHSIGLLVYEGITLLCTAAILWKIYEKDFHAVLSRPAFGGLTYG